MDVELYHGDNLDIFPLLEDESVDTIITDPPYGLEFMGKKWDRFSGGFSKNEDWAHGDLGGLPRQRKRNIKCPDCDKWIYDHPGRACKCGGVRRAQMQAFEEFNYKWAKEALRVAKPGAMLCAFGGTRTHHRLMCAIEDAGWEIRDVLMWLYGSGFPKSHAIGKAIDKAAGAEREVVGYHKQTMPQISPRGNFGSRYGDEGGNNAITSPATDAAALWDGYGTALKPAYEPIILAMKPLPGTFAQNALGYGVAGLAIDSCRVGTNGDDPNHRRPGATAWGNSDETKNCYGKGLSGRPTENLNPSGRWPANLLLSHAPGCECVGVRKVKGIRGGNSGVRGNKVYGEFGESKMGVDPGYASPDGTETVEAWNCVPECPVFLLDQSSGERPSAGHYTRSRGNAENEYSDAMFGDYPGYRDRLAKYAGETGGASRFFTRFHYSAKASRAERELGLLGHIPCLKCGLLDTLTHINPKTGKEEKCRRNGHPTVKPLDVCRWLCRLTKTPTGGVVLDPFMGSGRISMAAILEGRDTIGIELERPSFEIAQAAVRWAEEQVLEMVQAEMVV